MRARRATPTTRFRWSGLTARVQALVVVVGLSGCAQGPVAPAPSPSRQQLAAEHTPLGRLAPDAGVPPGRSGFAPLLSSDDARRVRLAPDRAGHGRA